MHNLATVEEIKTAYQVYGHKRILKTDNMCFRL